MAGEDPIVSGMAGRYALALFELARDSKGVDVVQADLDKLNTLISESADLDRLVRSMVFTSDDQMRAMMAVLDRAGITGIATNFVKLVIRNRRLFAIRDMMKAYRVLVARHKGEVSADVIVAEPLGAQHLAALTDALKSVTGKKDVQIDVTVDPAIIGGVVVKLGSRMIDASLRTKLNSIKHAMKEVG